MSRSSQEAKLGHKLGLLIGWSRLSPGWVRTAVRVVDLTDRFLMFRTCLEFDVWVPTPRLADRVYMALPVLFLSSASVWHALPLLNFVALSLSVLLATEHPISSSTLQAWFSSAAPQGWLSLGPGLRRILM